jgi:hypothetical protein
MDLLSQIKKSAKPDAKPTATASNVPVIDEPEIYVSVEKVRLAITAKKKAEADLEQYGEVVRDFFLETKEENARANNFRKSFKFVGKNKTEVMVKHANKVLKINFDDTDKIQKILGDNFDMLFETTQALFVKSEVLVPNSALGKRLFKMLGKNDASRAKNFDLFFDSKVGLKIKVDYDRNIFRLPLKMYRALGVFVKMIKPGLQ